MDQLKPDMFVVVEFAIKKTRTHFIGVIKNEDLRYLKKVANGFVFPVIEDISLVNCSDIKEILPNPLIGRRGKYSFLKNISSYNF